MSQKKLKATRSLIESTVRLFHRLRAASEELHGQGEFSSGRHGVLASLRNGGPQTVPDLARARPVSRQYIQSLVNPMLDEGWIELIDNPAHKRSKLVRVTKDGAAMVDAMERREEDALSRLSFDLAAESIEAATEVLESIRDTFESDRWRDIAAALQPRRSPKK